MKTIALSLMMSSVLFAGPGEILHELPWASDHPSVSTGFERARRPITNPTLFDLALPRTQVHAFFLHQKHPRVLSTTAGDLPVDGDFNLFAVQLEYAFHERFSFVALKDGYIDFNPDATLVKSEGFANLAAGFKYAFLYQPENQYVLSGIATIELPTGDSEVWQGTGDGALNLILSDLKLWGRLQTAGAAGLHIPFDGDAESFTGFLSAHLSYEISPWFIPLLEINWYHVFEEGDGSTTFDGQPPVSSLANFEGGDLINFGSANSGVGEDIVTLGIGFRSQLHESATIGFSWEFPLTEEEENLMDQRFTADLVWTF